MLRQQLQIACDHVSPERNTELVAGLVQQYLHTIVPKTSDHDLFGFTCLVHALGFTNTPQYLDVASLRAKDVYAGAAFANWLLTGERISEVAPDQAKIGSLVFYLDNDGSFLHVGLLKDNGRIESKWGQLGLYEHALFEVPANYGESIRFYKPIDFDKGIDIFYTFAETLGVQFE